MGQITVDFSAMTYEEWLKFLFEQELKEDVRAAFKGYSPVKRPANPAVLAHHLTRLCQEFPALVERFGWAQIGQGLWAYISIFDKYSVGQMLYDRSIPLETRLGCIRAMKLVFSEGVAKMPAEIPLPGAFEMWWDLICVYRDSGEPGTVFHKRFVLPVLMAEEPWSDAERRQKIRFFKSQAPPEYQEFLDLTEAEIRDFRAEEAPIIDAAFNTLKEILELGEARCVDCALHGLGHLLHPRKAELVQRYVDRNRNKLDSDTLRWLKECRDGTVQ